VTVPDTAEPGRPPHRLRLLTPEQSQLAIGVLGVLPISGEYDPLRTHRRAQAAAGANLLPEHLVAEYAGTGT
jgi:hypothetical protein